MSLVKFEKRKNQIGLITLNNPDQLNAMDEVMAQDFSRLINDLKNDSQSLKVLILTGAGRAFSAGGNLQMLKEKIKLKKSENKKRMLQFYNDFLCIRDLGIPIIAMINGHAIGAGLCLACACDIRIVAEGSKLGLTFTKLGLHPGMGATYFLPKILGLGGASDLLLTARIIQAEQAFEMGLVAKVVDSEQLEKTAFEMAEQILECGPESVSQLLSSLRGEIKDLKAALEREAEFQSINYAGSEFLEGVQATIEKRKPNYN